MRYQQRAGWCGPAALQNAFRMFGKKVSQQRIARLSGASIQEGTGGQGLIDAALALGLQAHIAKIEGQAWWAALLDYIARGWCVIACIEDWEHWVCIAGVANYCWDNPKFIIIDSTREKHNKAENGVRVVCAKDLHLLWRAPAAKAPKFYGIAVRPPYER